MTADPTADMVAAEATVYRTLTERDEATPKELTAAVPYVRSTVYSALAELDRRDLVEKRPIIHLGQRNETGWSLRD